MYRHGKAGVASLGAASCEEALRKLARQAGRGRAASGTAWHGSLRPGMAGGAMCGGVDRGKDGALTRGEVGCGRQGGVGQG